MHTSSRGASILAAISFVALLGIALIGIEAFSPANPDSQTATVAAAAPAPLTTKSKLDPQQICNTKKQEALGKDQSKDPDPQPYKKDTAIEKNDCIGAVFDSSKVQTAGGSDPKQNIANYKCVGESTTINIGKNGEGTITSEVNPSVQAGMCKAKFCDSSNHCTPEKTYAGGQGIQSWALDKSTFTSLTPDQQKEILGYGPIPAAQQSQLQSVFQDQKTAIDSANSAVAQQCGTAPDNSCQATINQQIAQKAGLDCLNANASEAGCVVNGGDAARALAANQQDLNQQLKQLAQAQVALDPNANSGACPGNAGCPGNPNGGNPNVTNPNGGSGNTFGGGSGTSGSSGSSGSSGLSSLLNGLMKGLTGSGALAPNSPPPVPAQACSTDPNTYAQQQQQYQQQLQQYNYQLQQAQYQQQLNQYYAAQSGGIAAPAQPLPAQPLACTPSTQNQCSTQPQQPAASSCTAGTWQPVYGSTASTGGTGSPCITSWQCGGAAGTATLSCQPQVADVGMSIAISYSCSAGTATGNGFTASGQSGTSTATVATPPQGTNTATYSLSCSNNGQTSGAQCSVQVTTPSIILVANPKTVHSGDTSQIGWITTGMQSCVISSPDQPDFTSQNSSNTSVNGTVASMPITSSSASSSASFVLHCQTVAGGTKDATTTVSAQN